MNTTKFKPGTSGNPKGRPKLSDELKQMKSISKEYLLTVFLKYSDYTLFEVKQIIKTRTLHFETLVALKIMLYAIEKNNSDVYINFILKSIFAHEKNRIT